MTSLLAIVNPAAGGGRCGKLAPDALAELRRAGLELDVWYTKAPGDAVPLARRALDEGYRDFVAVGGDGTSHEIVNGVAEALGRPQDRVSLGFLPLGTGNSFIRDYTRDGPRDAAEALRLDKRRACDVIRVEHDSGVLHFINIFSYGFVADVCTLANARFKRLGSAGYGVGVLAELAALRFAPVRLRVDGGPPWQQSAAFVSINNSQFTGGQMQMAPYANASDGKADLVVVGPMGRVTFLSLFSRIFSGQHVHHPAVTTCQARRVDFELEHPVPVMVDGEVVSLRPRHLEVLPGVLDVRI